MSIKLDSRKRTQRGFTLIELMIVVAIIGILASLAMASYRTYTIRAQVAEGLNLVGPVKTAMSEYYDNNGVFPADNAAAGLPAPNTFAGNYVESVTVNGDTASILYGNRANVEIDGETVTVVATNSLGSVSWNCSSGGVITETNLPKICR